jgi:hypothetical protein
VKDLNSPEFSPIFNDLLVRAQAEAERRVCAAAILNPAAVITLAKGWRPEIDDLAKSFWREIGKQREVLLEMDFDGQVNIICEIVVSDVDYWLLFAYQKSPAIEAARNALDATFYLRAARIGLPYILQLVRKEFRKWERI